MAHEPPTMRAAYIAIHPKCGLPVGITVDVDTPNEKRRTAKYVADWIKAGYEVKRVTVDDVRRAEAWCRCFRKSKQNTLEEK